MRTFDEIFFILSFILLIMFLSKLFYFVFFDKSVDGKKNNTRLNTRMY